MRKIITITAFIGIIGTLTLLPKQHNLDHTTYYACNKTDVVSVMGEDDKDVDSSTDTDALLNINTQRVSTNGTANSNTQINTQITYQRAEEHILEVSVANCKELLETPYQDGYIGEKTDSTDTDDILNSSSLDYMKTNDAEIDERVNEILSEIITEDMTTSDKVTAIYDWIINNTYYQIDPGYHRLSYVSMVDTKIAAQSYSVLFYGYGSCVNYSSAFVVMTRAIGLDSYVMRGCTYDSYEHSWVNVNIHGTLYTFDLQLEDYNWCGSGEVTRNYFCRTDDEIGYKFIYSDRNYDIEGFNDFKLY